MRLVVPEAWEASGAIRPLGGSLFRSWWEFPGFGGRHPDVHRGKRPCGTDTIRIRQMLLSFKREPPVEHNLEHTIALLARTPAALDALLRGLPEAWTHRNEGGSTWSAFDVVGHLIHADRTDWMPRAKVILQFGEGQPFPPFDRWGHARECEGKSLGQLLDGFARAREESMEELRALHLRPEDLERRGRHPAFGSVTLSELLATWAAHDLNHLHQISRIMAHQYRETVGPWSTYLGVMQCGGHSAPA